MSSDFEKDVLELDWDNLTPEASDFVIEFRKVMKQTSHRIATKPMITDALKKDKMATMKMIFQPVAEFMIKHKIIDVVLRNQECLNHR